MRNELKKPQMFYTSPDWINRREFPLSEWPVNRYDSGVRSRMESSYSKRIQADALAGIRKLERLGLL
jgi:hypothetical protein